MARRSRDDRVASGVTPDHLLALAFVAGAVGTFGLYLDTAWHRTLGRDTFWSLPHLLMYGSGVAVYASTLAGIVIVTRLGPGDFGGPVLARLGLRLPLGFTIAFAGTLVMMSAIPVDAWFHWMFGTDVPGSPTVASSSPSRLSWAANGSVVPACGRWR